MKGLLAVLVIGVGTGSAQAHDLWFKGSYLDRVPNTSSTRDSDYVYLATRFRF